MLIFCLFGCDFTSLLQAQPQPKRQKNQHMAPIVFIRLNLRKNGKPKPITIKALLDTGGSATLLAKNLTKKLDPHKAKSPTVWHTAAGQFTSSQKCKTQFTIPELHDTRLIAVSYTHLTLPTILLV